MIQDSGPLQSLSRTQLIEQVEQLKQELHNLQEDRSPGPPRNPPTAHPPKKNSDIQVDPNLDRSLAQLALDRSGHIVLWADQHGQLLYVNEAGCRSLGYSEKELRAMSIYHIEQDIPAELWPRIWKKIRRQKNGGLNLTSGERMGLPSRLKSRGTMWSIRVRPIAAASFETYRDASVQNKGFT